MIGIKQFLEKGKRSYSIVKANIHRAIIFTIGYILSPLTWWNDAFVNIPLSYVIASILAFFLGNEMFPLLFSLSYLFTNILGFALMHISVTTKIKYTAKKLIVDIVAALLYTLAICYLSYIGVIKPFL
ncbi:MAG: hypothetical protein DRO40_02490 [Thermoprotei archaeon]|nr:MAG: hypothetical protein DRO40_02490 [Thermoprotei archaeon]